MQSLAQMLFVPAENPNLRKSPKNSRLLLILNLSLSLQLTEVYAYDTCLVTGVSTVVLEDELQAPRHAKECRLADSCSDLVEASQNGNTQLGYGGRRQMVDLLLSDVPPILDWLQVGTIRWEIVAEDDTVVLEKATTLCSEVCTQVILDEMTAVLATLKQRAEVFV